MKRLVILLLALTLTNSVFAQQSINVVWAFSISNVPGSYFRATLDEANRIQKKYQFIPEHKPGAGGEVAATYVKEQKNITMLGTAAAFFVRPYLYPVKYNFNQFKPIHVMALAPVALVTKQGRTLEDILRQDNISIGTAGGGSFVHLVALKFQEYLPGKKITLVGYKSSTEAMQDVLGGHVDLAFEFLGDAEARNAKILGITGSHKIKNYPLLKDIGYPNQETLTGMHLILAKADMPPDIYKEIKDIFTEAEKNQAVQNLYASDYSSKPRQRLRTPEEYDIWYTQTIKQFEKLTKGVNSD